MMPDFSFAPFGYLTNMIDANMSRAAAVPRGWPKEREAIYSSGRSMPWNEKKKMATPSTPSFKPIRVKEGEAVLCPEEQKMYQCGVDILL